MFLMKREARTWNRTTKVFDHLWANGNKPVPQHALPVHPAHQLKCRISGGDDRKYIYCWFFLKNPASANIRIIHHMANFYPWNHYAFITTSSDVHTWSLAFKTSCIMSSIFYLCSSTACIYSQCQDWSERAISLCRYGFGTPGLARHILWNKWQE